MISTVSFYSSSSLVPINASTFSPESPPRALASCCPSSCNGRRPLLFQAAELNPASLEAFTAQMADLEQTRYDKFQNVIAGAPPPPDPTALLQMQMMMMLQQQQGGGGVGGPMPMPEQQQQLSPAAPAAEPADPAAEARAERALEAAQVRAAVPRRQLRAQGCGCCND